MPSFSHPGTFWVTHLPALPDSTLCKLAHPVLVLSSTSRTMKSPSNHPVPHQVAALPRHAPFPRPVSSNWNSAASVQEEAQYNSSHALLGPLTTPKVRLGLGRKREHPPAATRLKEASVLPGVNVCCSQVRFALRSLQVVFLPPSSFIFTQKFSFP